MPLDPQQVYLFGIHPHGVIGIAVWANMFNTVAPVLRDIRYRIVTLASNFYIPIAREWLLWLGLIGSDKQGILYCLERGISVAIVVGGAAGEWRNIVLHVRPLTEARSQKRWRSTTRTTALCWIGMTRVTQWRHVHARTLTHTPTQAQGLHRARCPHGCAFVPSV